MLIGAEDTKSSKMHSIFPSCGVYLRELFQVLHEHESKGIPQALHAQGKRAYKKMQSHAMGLHFFIDLIEAGKPILLLLHSEAQYPLMDIPAQELPIYTLRVYGREELQFFLRFLNL